MKHRSYYWITALLIALFFGALASCKGESQMEESTSMEEESTAPVTMDDNVTRGKDLYQQNGCTGCHGEEGRGDGPAGQALNPKPRNFHDTEAYKQGTSLEDIANTIKTGIPGTAMVAYPHIPESDRKLIASYIVYLQSRQ